MQAPERVLAVWLDELGEKAWYSGGDAIDARIRSEFETTWREAMAGGLGLWLTYPSGLLAYLIVTDQFPRNMFRGEARAYVSDRLALSAARCAVDRGWDMRINEPARQFFYLPFEHSECLTDQDRAVRLIKTRLTSAENLLHARAHREVIRQFGRFPFRNEHLGRKSTEAERDFLARGGYGATVATLKAA